MTKIFLRKKDFQALVNLENNEKLSIELKDLDFPVRAMNSLSSQGLKTLGELVLYSEYDLRSFPNMGRKSIEEIKNILQHYSLYLGMNLKQFNSEDNKKIDHQQNKEWSEVSKKLILELIKDFNEIPLSLRSKNALLNLGCNYLGDIISINKSELFRIRALGYKSILEIEDYLKSLNLNFGDQLDPWNKDLIIKLREELREQVLETKKFELIDQDKYLEVELKRVLNEAIQISKKDKSQKDRVVDILNSRFGLDGSPAKTLEIIGQKYNVTRERIRQNESYGLRKLRFSKPITPILDKIFEILNLSLPITEIEFNRILREKGLTNLEWDFKGLQDFYESFGPNQNFYISKVNKIKVISKANVENIFKKVMVHINKKISNNGILSLSSCLKFEEIYLNDLKRETIKKFIQTKPQFTWLDDNEEWFTFYSRRNRLSNLVTKAATSSNKVDIENLFKKIKNFHRFDNVRYSKEILINFCKKSFDCEISVNEIIFKSPQSKISYYEGYQGKIISPNEQKIIDIFENYGPILNWWDLKKLANIFDVSEASLTMMMQFSVLFKRIDKATYSLSNSKFNLANIKILKIDISNESYSLDESEYLPNKSAYIEVYDYGEYKFTLNYPRPLRLVENKFEGVEYKNRVFIVS